MKYTFYLKKPKSDKETLILFSCYFNDENKRFVYSTQEKIKPSEWDFENNTPIFSGKNKSKSSQTIKSQINRYSDALLKVVNQYKMADEVLDSKTLKKAFDVLFKKAATGKNIFFDAYDVFTAEKIKGKEWSASTIKRYKNIKNILENFEEAKKFKFTFSKINHTFHREFTAYCMDDLGHINNTYARNLGLFKTFMFWAKKNKYTFNETFTEFKKVERVITNQVALTIDDLNKLMSHEFESKKLEKVRDVFVFACVTGMRFGELSLILSKYEYKLPLIANQKQNEYIKDVFEELKYNHKIQKVTTKGKENIKEEMFFYDRISTHTARRTFITMMKRQGKSDKLIASITGHTDMKTLNQYYQVDSEQKKEAMEEVFNVELKLKVV
jgi:integrase